MRFKGIAFGLALLLPALMLAQDTGIEVTPTFGFRWGGEINAASTDLFDEDVKVDESMAYGLLVDFPVTRGLQIELLAERQSTNFGSGELFDPDELNLDVDITYYHIGVLYQWRSNQIYPYVAGGVGIAEISPDQSGVSTEDRFSGSLGGGFKVPLSDHVGFRFEGRGFWTDTGGWDCEWNDDHHHHGDWDCQTDLLQGEVKVGLVLSF
jgi:hypothetical protein